MDKNLKLLRVHIHLEERVAEEVSEAAGVEEAVRPSIAPLVIDLRELEAAVLQQLVVVKFLVGQVNL